MKISCLWSFFRSGIFSLMYEMTVSLLNHDIIMRWTPYGFFIGSARISVTTFMRWLKNGLAISKLKCEENNPICIIKGPSSGGAAAAKWTFGSSSSPLDAATPNKRESIWKFSISSWWRKLSYNFCMRYFYFELGRSNGFLIATEDDDFFRNQTTEWFEREPSFYTVWKRSKWCYYQTNSQNDIKLWTYSKSNQAFCL